MLNARIVLFFLFGVCVAQSPVSFADVKRCFDPRGKIVQWMTQDQPL